MSQVNSPSPGSEGQIGQTAGPPESAATIARKLGPLAWLAVIAVVFPVLGGFATLYYINPLAAWFRSHGDIGPLLYAAGFAVIGGVALLPTYAQSALGGWAFGFAVGGIAALCGFAGAALLAYFIARRAGGTRAQQLIVEHPKWKAVYDALVGTGFWRALLIVTLLRLPPNSPFALTNLVLAATGVPLAAYTVGTIVGLAPRTLFVVFVAAQLQTFSLDAIKQPWILVVNVAAALIVIAIIGALASRALRTVTARPANGNGNPQPEV